MRFSLIFFYPVLLLWITWGLPAAELRDPFEDNGGAGAERQAPEPPACLVTLQYDCIALPHAEANRLLRENFPSPAAAGALRNRLKPLLSLGTARRIAMDGMLLRHSGSLEPQTNLPGPGEQYPSVKIEEFLPGGGVGNGVILPSITPSAMRFEAGPKVAATALASPDRRWVHLEMGWSWHGYRGSMIWGRKTGQTPQGVWQAMEFGAHLRVPRDEWRLCAMLCPSAAGDNAVMEPLATDRWLLFVRACPDQPVREAVDGPMDFIHDFRKVKKSAGVLVEWIVMDGDAAADLIAAHSGIKGDRALRHAVQWRMENGSVQLFDSAWMAFDGGEEPMAAAGKFESGYKFSVPEDELPFNLQQDRSERQVSDGPGAPAQWHQIRTGSAVGINNSSWDSTTGELTAALELEWKALAGFREEGTPPGRMHAHFASLKQNVAVDQPSGEPRLAGMAPLPEAPVFGPAGVPVRPRAMLTFVTPVY